MTIRSNKNAKDRLRDIPVVLQSVPVPISRTSSLRFRTQHKTKPVDVDLTVFATGQEKPKQGKSKGAFRGRPELIEELAPALADHLSALAKKSVHQHVHALRTWWRLMDEVEAEAPHLQPVTSVAHLNELHRNRARATRMSRLPFGNFLLHVNTTRRALGLKAFFWPRPESAVPKRKLPPTWQTDMVRHKLKHNWFSVVDRWELADALLATQRPVVDAQSADALAHQSALLKGYLRLERAIQETGHPRPEVVHLQEPGNRGKEDFYADGILLMDILRGRYPDGSDIRTAFHLCLATTGWNPAVLLALDANAEFIEPHPRSPSRYILRGIKDRAAGAEQISEGLFKSQGSAGFILKTLLQRTAPLRAELVRLREALLGELNQNRELSEEERERLRAQMDELSEGIRSPWLFVSHVKDGIHWLSDFNFAGSTLKRKSFLQDVVDDINRRQPIDRQLAYLRASDLRDAYAARVYFASGGSVLAVMKALGHRSLTSTQAYTENTLLNEEHRKLFGIFSGAFWSELRVNGRVDPTMLAKISRDGPVTAAERERLASYRSLLRSRLGVGCKDPTNPPKHMAPNFVPDGVRPCPIQRCLLCLTHAVLLPESHEGLCMRACELEFVREGMSVVAWQQSSFAEELDNIELALSLFDSATTLDLRKAWSERIKSGTHQIPVFDGSEDAQ